MNRSIAIVTPMLVILAACAVGFATSGESMHQKGVQAGTGELRGEPRPEFDSERDVNRDKKGDRLDFK